MINKKGAMFGLDARIALAIFGALSVISGAALYSAIKEAREQRVITSMVEVAKGLEAYYLDTGIMPKTSTYSSTVRDIVQLVKNTDNIVGWSGPYISQEIVHEDGASVLPNLKIFTGCQLDQSSNSIPELGYGSLKLRDFAHASLSDVRVYRIHIQCVPNEIAEAISQKFNGKDIASSDGNSVVFFNDYGDGHKQLYYTVINRKE